MQRLNEMSGELDILSASQFQSAPSILQMKTSQEVAAMLDRVREILALLKPRTDVQTEPQANMQAEPQADAQTEPQAGHAQAGHLHCTPTPNLP